VKIQNFFTFTSNFLTIFQCANTTTSEKTTVFLAIPRLQNSRSLVHFFLSYRPLQEPPVITVEFYKHNDITYRVISVPA